MAEKNNSLEKALAVLDLFQYRSRWTLTEIAQETGYSNAAVARMLNSMESMHYIYQDKINGGYYLGDKIYVLGRKTQLKNQLINVLDEPVETLCRRCGFSVTVAIRRDYHSVTVLRKDPQTGLTMSLIQSVGDRMSLNATAAGKILTAFSENPERLVDRMEYVKLTTRSIADRNEFADLMHEVRSQKLAYDMEEVTEGLVCVAAPVLDKNGIAICAISLNGYKERMIQSLYNTIMKLQDCVHECERLLQ
jgi:DNA-binding IclR family transcriptional regulator